MRNLIFIISALSIFDIANSQTLVSACGFECGVQGSIGQHWNFESTSASFSTTTIRSAARSLRSNPAGTVQYGAYTSQAAGQTFVVRFFVRFTTLPSADCDIFSMANSGAFEGVAYKNSDGKLYPIIYNAGFTFGSTGFSVSTGIWYRVDVKLIATGNPHTIDVQINGTSLTQLTRTVASANYTASTLRIGNAATSGTMDAFFDDFTYSTTSGDYPIGDGKVDCFIPTSDGTHNVAGSGDFQRTLTGTDILNATTTAFQLVDDAPLESGSSVDWINIVAPPNATDYVECKFGAASGSSTPTTVPRMVSVIAAIHHAGTGTGNMEIRLLDNATTNNIYSATAVAGTTTIIYKTKDYATAPSTSGAWNASSSGNAAFNNLKFRFGSPAAVDANPDQYLDCIMIEAEITPDNSTIPGTPSDKRHTLLGVGGVAFNKIKESIVSPQNILYDKLF